VQPHPKSFELVKIQVKSPKISAKCNEIWAKYVQIFAKLLHVRLCFKTAPKIKVNTFFLFLEAMF